MNTIQIHLHSDSSMILLPFPKTRGARDSPADRADSTGHLARPVVEDALASAHRLEVVRHVLRARPLCPDRARWRQNVTDILF